MSKDSVIAIGVIAAILGLAALLVAGGLATTSTTTSSTVSEGAAPDPPADGSHGIVLDLMLQPGQRVFGIRLRSDRYFAHVSVVVPAACVIADADGAQTLREDGECADLPVRGELSGGGTGVSGVEFAIVRVQISEACFESVSRGDAWPSDMAACSAEP